MPRMWQGDVLFHAFHVKTLVIELVKDIDGWSPGCNRVDFMHSGYQGHCQNAAGSTLVELVLEGFFGNSRTGYAKLLAKAWLLFKLWCVNHKIQCSVPKFTRARLSWSKANDWPQLTGKAWHCRVILSWPFMHDVRLFCQSHTNGGKCKRGWHHKLQYCRF